MAVPTDNGKSVALSQIATLEYGFERGIIWHRNRLPTVTVRADIYGKEQPATLVQQILPTREDVRAALPDGYLLEVGGTVEDSSPRAGLGEGWGATVYRGRADAADGATAQLFAHGDGVFDSAAGRLV